MKIVLHTTPIGTAGRVLADGVLTKSRYARQGKPAKGQFKPEVIS